MPYRPFFFFKELKSTGGPASFQKKFIHWLKKNEIEYDFLSIKNVFKKKILILNAGTFNLPLLFLSLIFKTKLIQRLDGFYDFSNIGRNTRNLKCLLINFIMQFIRKYLADYIIYQSLISKKLWDKNFNKVKTKYSMIHNPSFNVLSNFKNLTKKSNFYNIVIVEGNIENNFFNNKILDLINNASKKNNMIDKIYIFGNIDQTLKKKYSKYKNILIKNTVNHNKLKKFYRKNNIIFFGIEFNPCCSNSIIEANSYGIPSITLNTGSYKELMLNSGIQINFKDINEKNLELKITKSLSNIIKYYPKYMNLSYKNSIRFKPDRIFNMYLNCIYKN